MLMLALNNRREARAQISRIVVHHRPIGKMAANEQRLYLYCVPHVR